MYVHGVVILSTSKLSPRILSAIVRKLKSVGLHKYIPVYESEDIGLLQTFFAQETEDKVYPHH